MKLFVPISLLITITIMSCEDYLAVTGKHPVEHHNLYNRFIIGVK